jgi:hypothetical protein
MPMVLEYFEILHNILLYIIIITIIITIIIMKYISTVTKRRGLVVNNACLVFWGSRVQVSSPETGYPDWGFRGFPQFPQENSGIEP